MAVQPGENLLGLPLIGGQFQDHMSEGFSFENLGIGKENVHRSLTFQHKAGDHRLFGFVAVENQADLFTAAALDLSLSAGQDQLPC